MTPREQVLQYLRTVEKATLWEINQGIKHRYYANGAKHLGAVLSRLVNRGLVERIKKGAFRIAPPPSPPEQLDLKIGLFKDEGTH
jgi:hypothetical protein